MILRKLDEFTRGWFVGDFEPSVEKTAAFEVGVLSHRKGEKWPKHYHKIAREINLLLEGHMDINGQEIFPGTIFIIEPEEIAKPTFHADCKVLVIKTPSIQGDKYEVL